MNQVLLDILSLSAIYSIVILGLGFIAGLGGLFSVVQAGMFGLGAFTYSGLYAYHAPTDLIVALPAAAAVGAVVSATLALVALRVSGDFFVVASFGLQIVLVDSLYNWNTVTGGPSGVYGLPTPHLLGKEFGTPAQNTALVICCAIVCYLLSWWLRRAPFGRLVRAMGADEVALQAAGFRPARLKLATFVIGGALASLAGVLYASYIGIAQVGDFDINASMLLLAAVLMGGSRSLFGSVLGAALFIGIPRLLSLLNTPASLAGPLQQLVFGLFLIMVMLFLPGGITSGLSQLVTSVRDAALGRRQGSRPESGPVPVREVSR